jgi:hypothetical protein
MLGFAASDRAECKTLIVLNSTYGEGRSHPLLSQRDRGFSKSVIAASQTLSSVVAIAPMIRFHPERPLAEKS